MVGNPKNEYEGDLFPRGAAPNSTPRVKKRNGQILFGPQLKRPRRTQGEEDATVEDIVKRHGGSLSFSRLSAGMTTLALVTRTDFDGVEFIIPGGIRAAADPDEILIKPHSSSREATVLRSANPDSESSDTDGEGMAHVPVPLYGALHVGTVVLVSVIDIDGNYNGRKVARVSLKPELVNVGLNPKHVLQKGFPLCGTIKSVEDHGYIVSFGTSIPHTGFLAFNKCHVSRDEKTLQVGTPVETVTVSEMPLPKKRSKNFSAVVKLSSVRAEVLHATLESSEALTYRDLCAGMVVKAKVVQKGEGGVMLTAFGVFDISVDATHIPRLEDGTLDITIGKQVRTRLLFVDSALKRIGGTLLDSLVKSRSPRHVPSALKTGTVLQNLVVDRIIPGFGVLLRFSLQDMDEEKSANDSEKMHVEHETNASLREHGNMQHCVKGIPLFAHLSRVSDTKGLKLESIFHQGMALDTPARLISVSQFDGIINVDLRPSVLSRKALCIEEVEAGAVYDCRILSHTTLGSISVAVDGDPYLNGIVPHMHVSDVPIPTSRLSKHPHLRIGALLKCRVLNVKVDRGKIYLTARRSLVHPAYPVLSSFNQAKSALSANLAGSTSSALFSGTSRRVTAKGSLLVEFCNGVNGLVRPGDLSLDEDKRKTPSDIETVYPIGETVHVRLVEADPINRRLLLSMCLGHNCETTGLGLRVGKAISGAITGVDEQTKSFVVSVSDSCRSESQKGGREEVHMISGKNSAAATCHLPFGHLSDDPGLSERLAIEVKRELRTEAQASSKAVDLEDLLVLSTDMDTPILSMKQSLRQSAKARDLPETFEEIQRVASSEKKDTKVTLCGYVKALLPSGVIIGFLGDLVGFVRKSRIADQFIPDPARFLKMHQTCHVVLDDVDVSKRRFSLSMRESEIGSEGYEKHCQQLFPCINEWKSILNRKTLERTTFEKHFKIGALIEAPPSSTRPFGTLYSLKAGDFDAVGVSLNTSEANPEVVLDGEHRSSFSIEKIDMENADETQTSDAKKHTLRVLDVDPFSGVIDLSTDKDVLSGGRKKCSVSANRRVSARVVLVKKMYIILKVEISKNRSVIAFAPGPALQNGLMIRPGAIVSGKVLQAYSQHGSRVVMAIDRMKFKDRSSVLKDGRVLGALPEVTSIRMLKTMASQDESAVVGMQISGVVTKGFQTHVYVGIGPGVVGHLHITKTGAVSQEELDTLPLGPVPNRYASRFSLPRIGTMIRPAFVCGVRRNEDEEHGTPMALELALRRDCPNPVWQVGNKVIGFLQSVSQIVLKSSGGISEEKSTAHMTTVAVGPNIRVSCSDVNCLFDDSSVSLKVGLPVVCMISEVDDHKPTRGIISDNGGEQNGPFLGIIRDIIPGHGVKVLIPWHARSTEEKSIPWGMVDICDISSNFDEAVKNMETLQEGDVVRVRRLPSIGGEKQKKGDNVFLSMRSPGHEESRDPLITVANASSLKQGTKIRGFVRSVDKKGCFVSIGRGVSAHVKLCDLSDEYVVDPKKSFPVGALVQGKIDGETNNPARISLVLRRRPRRSLGDDRVRANLTEGATVSGFVRRVEPYGAMIEIAKDMSALLHKSEVDQDRFIENTFDEWVVGQRVTAIVIKAENGKYRLGTKRCYFEAAGLNASVVSAILEQNDKAKSQVTDKTRDESIKTAKDGNDMESEMVSDADGHMDNGSDGSDEGNETCNVDMDGSRTPSRGEEGQTTVVLNYQEMPSSVTPLQISSGFDFEEPGASCKDSELMIRSAREEGLDIEMSDSGEDHAKKRTRDKRENKRRRDALEKEVRIREETIANNPDSPETVEDYERLLMGYPNNSVLWIRYMAFCLGLSQIDKARSVAERALESISLELEDERVNLWCAYVNLEAEFGMMNSKDPELNDSMGIKRDAAVLRVFERACERITNVKDFHLRVISALRKSNSGLAEEIMQRAIRRFKGFEDVWIARGQAQFIEGDVEAARQTLERALITLDKQKHIAVISKFAQFEYKHGSSERGRTVFESLVGSFPKRLDLWNVYLDMEVRRCRDASPDVQSDTVRQIRTLFQRLVSRDFSSKKMKFAFKKWLNFEKTFGNKESQTEVKQKAREYVERNVSSAS
ncbi:rRNA biogenesis protein RRP5 [Gracilariopsis chorda]|uniref:rRNA biogenesis protein RRP5 n=1 Tax=Gracilariopsis chorda TaxID=448386 RepID=A0A2V3IH00_9FLOR|nr:rRNA biogenesis protein RRP5 [Gracilariopsis chorda]|eukprot:PXF41293.1 rRNA biogenesis protein RRP5 [Gracilariopsis chorda]